MNNDELERQIFILGKSFKLLGSNGDTYFESHLDNSGLAEQDILNLLAASISASDWVVDVGANIGYVSLAMSILCPKGKIFAFEPGKTTYKLLKKNMAANKVKNIVLNEVGLSDSKSSARLTYSLTNSSGAFVDVNKTDNIDGHGSDSIKLIRLDDEYKRLGITKCALIKVDVEGHEPNFLKGAGNFIKKFKPEAIIEANHWCLNVFNRTSLPTFIDLTYKNFPYIYAFQNGDYLDLSEDNSRYKFYYENTVNNNYMNIYCGFDKNLMIGRLNLAFGAWDKLRKLTTEKQGLEEQLEKLRNSRALKSAATLNRMIGRK